MSTKATDVFNTPELLSIICNYSTNKERVQLACASHLAFTVSASRIWCNLKSLRALLMLLSPITAASMRENPEARKAHILPYSPQNFERFDLYGQFVKKIIITTPWSSPLGFRPSVCSPLVDRAQLGPLLPNLLELQLSNGFKLEEEFLFWISLFISPSLRRFDAGHVGPTASTSLTNTVNALALLSTTCPNLEGLAHMFSLSMPDDANDSTITMIRSVLLPLACSHLRTFQNLSRLLVHGQFINAGSLVTISQLPRLETFDIYQLRHRNVNMAGVFRSTSLPSVSFSRLAAFSIWFGVMDDFVAIMETMKVAKGVSEIFLRYKSLDDEARTSIYAKEVLELVSLSIAKYCPQVHSIILEGTHLANPTPTSSTASAWAYLSSLPLRSLALSHFNPDDMFMKNMFPLWAGLEILSIPHHQLTFEHLARLGQLPELRILVIKGIDFGSSIPETGVGVAAPLNTVNLCGELEQKTEVRNAEKMARFLRSVWPSFQRVAYRTKAVSQEGLDLLNLYLQVIQGVTDIEKKLSARLEPNVVSSLLPLPLSFL